MGFPVEYALSEGDKGFSPEPILDMGSKGRYVFLPNEDYGGRRIVDAPTYEIQQAMLRRNPAGSTLWVEPTDIKSKQERELIREIVREELDARGLTAEEPRRKPGRPRKDPGNGEA